MFVNVIVLVDREKNLETEINILLQAEPEAGARVWKSKPIHLLQIGLGPTWNK